MADQTGTYQDWFMYHVGYGHGGNAGSGSPLTSETVSSSQFQLLNSIQTNGCILSVPAIVDGFIYVGLGNSHDAPGSVGGSLQKYNISTGQKVEEFTWPIKLIDRDSHGFTGMGCTPTVINGFVYFVGFNATLYCLNQSDLTLVWSTDLRYADPAHNQPTTNTIGVTEHNSLPPAAGWSSPMVINFQDGPRIFLGIGEGENPNLFSFIFCLDGNTGNVVWIYCTNQFTAGQPNPVNQLPKDVLLGDIPPMYTVFDNEPVCRGCSVWAAIAYSADTGLIYASTGQPASPTDQNIDNGLPSVGWSSGILALNAVSGEFVAFTQMPSATSYRPSDLDVDIGSAPTLFTLPGGQLVVGVGCKNGGFMVCDAKSLQVLNSVSLLPRLSDGTQIPEVDPHPAPADQNALNPPTTNDVSNANQGENYSGPFNTAAVDPVTGTLFIGIGGPNYHNASPGIDYNSTPFMKAIKWDTLVDAWPLDGSDPAKYANVGASMYTNAGESGLSSPAVVNDVVFVTTSKISIYAYKVSDGTLIWTNDIGNQTMGFNGGYGYCLGPAIWGSYVVAGALIQGLNGGILNIYGLTQAAV